MGKAGFIKRRMKAQEKERAEIAAKKRTKQPKPELPKVWTMDEFAGEPVEMTPSILKGKQQMQKIIEGRKNIERAKK